MPKNLHQIWKYILFAASKTPYIYRHTNFVYNCRQYELQIARFVSHSRSRFHSCFAVVGWSYNLSWFIAMRDAAAASNK